MVQTLAKRSVFQYRSARVKMPKLNITISSSQQGPSNVLPTQCERVASIVLPEQLEDLWPDSLFPLASANSTITSIGKFMFSFAPTTTTLLMALTFSYCTDTPAQSTSKIVEFENYALQLDSVQDRKYDATAEYKQLSQTIRNGTAFIQHASRFRFSDDKPCVDCKKIVFERRLHAVLLIICSESTSLSKCLLDTVVDMKTIQIPIIEMAFLRNCLKCSVDWLFRRADGGFDTICYCYCYLVSATIVLLHLCIKFWMEDQRCIGNGLTRNRSAISYFHSHFAIYFQI